VRDEAIVHGAYELVERDAYGRARQDPRRCRSVDPRTLDAHSGELLDRFHRAGVRARITYLDSPVGVPCFAVRIVSDNHPVVFEGYGCHGDRDVALCRALAEAAQSRVTAIAGTRDDIEEEVYAHQARLLLGSAAV
jgi:YcaO-like protein with predicted kinase domain